MNTNKASLFLKNDMKFQLVGRYSLLMWFIHCIFFNNCKDIFQPILYWPRNPILVLLWGISICYILVLFWNIPLKFAMKYKKVMNMRSHINGPS